MEYRPTNHSAEQNDPSATENESPWYSALAELIQSRIALIRLESRLAQKTIATKAAACALAIIASITAWPCMVIGIIGLLSHFTPLPWWASTFLIGLLHLIIAFIALQKLRASTQHLYPITCSEFHKDKLWMQTFKKSKH